MSTIVLKNDESEQEEEGGESKSSRFFMREFEESSDAHDVRKRKSEFTRLPE